ncbi:alpha/beta-hydrolase, partial [Sarocladium strictum]
MYCPGYVFATMALPYSQCTTERGLVYSYVHVAPKTHSGTYLLFLHGFPSTSYHWRYQIDFFAKKGYGILAPDLLGFGATSKPQWLEMYKAKDMAMDIIDIMRAEGVDKVVGIGHDWGSQMLSRLANYHPDRFSAYAFIDHGYGRLGQDLSPQSIEHIDASVQEKCGFSILGYFLFFNEADAPEILNQHSDAVESIYFTTDDTLNKKYKGAHGGMRAWLTESKATNLPEYLTAEDRSYYQQTFSKDNGGYGACINWYRAA